MVCWRGERGCVCEVVDWVLLEAGRCGAGVFRKSWMALERVETGQSREGCHLASCQHPRPPGLVRAATRAARHTALAVFDMFDVQHPPRAAPLIRQQAYRNGYSSDTSMHVMNQHLCG